MKDLEEVIKLLVSKIFNKGEMKVREGSHEHYRIPKFIPLDYELRHLSIEKKEIAKLWMKIKVVIESIKWAKRK